MKLPKIGLRNIKTSVAVAVCLLLFLPGWCLDLLPGYWALLGPVNAVVATILCMQHSIESSWQVGLTRLLGTLVGGVAGCGVMFAQRWLPHDWLLVPIIGLGVMVLIWFCLLIGQPTACNVTVIIFCIVVLMEPQPGAERYISALFRMLETAVGILVAVGVNYLLPGERIHDDDPVPEK